MKLNQMFDARHHITTADFLAYSESLQRQGDEHKAHAETLREIVRITKPLMDANPDMSRTDALKALAEQGNEFAKACLAQIEGQA